MENFVSIIAYIFDFFILLIYLREIVGKRKTTVPLFCYYCCFVFVELLFIFNEHFITFANANSSLYFNTSISLATTFLLCFLFESSIKHKVFSTISFQVFVLLSENILTFLVKTINPEIFKLGFPFLNTFFNFGSKCILLLILGAFIKFWNRKRNSDSLEYAILLFSTPVISLIIMLAAPAKQIAKYESDFFYSLLFSALIILNLINYILLLKINQNNEIQLKFKQSQQQITFQKEKYKQLNAAYRNTRSVVHDTKNHYFAIQKLIEEEAYERLKGYTFSAINSLESKYAAYNTGNLVLDSFLTNYINVTANEGIQFSSEINVSADRIPVNDYDLCVLLGNLLDNCLNACRQNIEMPNSISIQITTDDYDLFTIHSTNTYNPLSEPKKEKNSFYHGYGMDNMKNVTEKYHGTFEAMAKEKFHVYIIIPIIEVKKRIQKPI